MTATNAQVAALLAMLNADLASLSTPRSAYERDDAPTSGRDYVILDISRMAGGNLRGDVLSPSRWRLTVRPVGSVTNVRALLDRCTNALEHKRVTVAGQESTGISFETESAMSESSSQVGLWSAGRSFTYAY